MGQGKTVRSLPELLRDTEICCSGRLHRVASRAPAQTLCITSCITSSHDCSGEEVGQFPRPDRPSRGRSRGGHSGRGLSGSRDPPKTPPAGRTQRHVEVPAESSGPHPRNEGRLGRSLDTSMIRPRSSRTYRTGRYGPTSNRIGAAPRGSISWKCTIRSFEMAALKTGRGRWSLRFGPC